MSDLPDLNSVENNAPGITLGNPDNFQFDPIAAANAAAGQAPASLHNPDFANNPQRGDVKAILNDPENLGGKLPQAVAQSKTDDNPQDFRSLAANMKALSFFTGKDSPAIATNYEQEKQQFAKAQGWDMPNSEGAFNSQMRDYFNAQEARQQAVEDLHSQALLDAENSPSAPNALQSYQEWNTKHADALAGVPESEAFNTWKQNYYNQVQQLQGEHYDIAKQLVDLYGNLPKGQQEASDAGQAAGLAAEGLEAPLGLAGNQPALKAQQAKEAQKTQLLQKITALPVEDRQRVYHLAASLEKAKNPDNYGWATSLYSLGQAASRSLDWLSPDSPDVSTQQGRMKLELQHAAKDIINPLPYSNLNGVQAWKNGLPVGLTQLGQGLAGAVPTMGAFAATGGIGGVAYMLGQSTVENRDRLLVSNPTMSDKEALSFGYLMAVPETAIQSISFMGLKGVFKPLEKALAEWGTGKLLLANTFVGGVAFSASEALGPLSDAALHHLNPDWQPNSNIKNLSWLKDVLMNAPQNFGMALAFAFFHVGHKPDIEEGKKVVLDAINEAQKPDAPKVVTTADGSKVIMTTDQKGEPKEVFRTKDPETAVHALEIVQDERKQKAQDEQVSWEEQMHQAEAEAKAGLLEGVPGVPEVKENKPEAQARNLTNVDENAEPHPDETLPDDSNNHSGNSQALKEQLQRAEQARSSIEEIIDNKAGESVAMDRPGIGEIHVTWGNPGVMKKGRLVKGSGLSHIIDQRNLEGEDGHAVARMMADVLAHGQVTEIQGEGTDGERLKIEYQGHTAILSLYEEKARKSWLVSGWKNEDGGQGVNPRPAYSTDPSGIRGQQGASYRLIAYNEHLVNPADSAKVKQQLQDFLANRATGESGFLDLTPIYNKLSEYGRSIYEKGMTFADWSKRMISDLGDKVKNVLAKVWNAYKSLGNAGSIGSKSDDFAKRVKEGQNAKVEKFTSDHTGEELSLDSVKNPDSRERIQAELDRRRESGPDAKTRIFENAAKRFDAITKRQDGVMKAFAKGDTSSSEVVKKDMERNLVEVNAILSALPPDVRASLSRNWRNPSTGEGGNIYTKYASLGSNKAKADFLIKQIDRASDLIDHALSSEYLERGYKLLESAQPFNERGKGLQGKITAEGHQTINEITDLWHMDEGQVADYIQARQKQLADPEISDEKRNEIEQQIHLANIHGNFSPVDAKGTYKHLGDEMPAETRAQAIESLKGIIRDGKLDWQAEKDANKAKWENNRAEAKKSLLGRDGEANSAEIEKARQKSQTALAGFENWLDSHLSHLARFDQLLGSAASSWKRRILDATNQKADLDQQIDHDSHTQLIKSIFGEKAEDNLRNRTRLKMVIADLSKPKDTGAFSLENQTFKKLKISRADAEQFTKDRTTWMGTDTELNYLSRSLSSLGEKSRVNAFHIYLPDGEGDKVELHLSPLEAVQRLLSWRQPDARLKMERNGMTQETADALEKFVEKSKNASAFYDYLKNGAYDRYPQINAIYREMFGVDMPRVKNYAPTYYDTAKASDDPVNLDEYGGGASSMAGFTKTRQSHAAKVRDSNAWTTYQAHTEAVNYWITHAPLVRDVRATFGNADVLRAAGAKSVADRKYLTDFIKYLSRDNSTVGNLTGWNSQFARAASNILSNSALAFNIPVTLKHIIPAMSSAMRMDAGDFMYSALRVATMSAERPALFGKDNLYSSPEVMRFANAAHSGSDADAVQAATESKGVGAKAKLALEAGGKWGHSWITSFVHASNSISSAIAYDGAYRQAVKLGLTHEEADSLARQKVDEVLHDTSQPVFGIDRPIGEEGNPIQATIARFAGPVRQRFGVAYEAAKNTGKTVFSDSPLGEKAGAIGGLSWKLAAAWVIPGIMEHAIKQGWLAIMGTKQQQEDADRLSEYIASAIAGPAYGIYWAGPVAVAGIRAALTHDKAYLTTGNPVFDEFNSVSNAIHRVTNKKGDKKPITDAISLSKAGMDAAAMLLGLIGLKHSATAFASVSGALNPARVVASKLEDDGKIKKRK
jgi:hypothetical protein